MVRRGPPFLLRYTFFRNLPKIVLVKSLVPVLLSSLEMSAEALVAVRCGNVTLTEGRMGRVGDRVAIRVTKQLRKPNTTFAMFEKADEQTKLMEAQ